MLVFGGVESFFHRHQTKQMQGFLLEFGRVFSSNRNQKLRSGFLSVWRSAHPKRKWLGASQDVHIYIYVYILILYIYIYIGQPRGVFKGSCHCNPSQELGHSWIQFEEQMFQTDFLHTKNARRKCLKHQRQRRFFVRWGFGSNFGAFDVRPKISGGGTTTDFSRWCFQFFFMFTPAWRSGPI